MISYRSQLAHVFFHLNNSSGNKWFNFKIPSQNVYTIVSFPTCFPTGYLKPIVLEFYHILAQGRVLDLQLNQFFLALTSFFKFFVMFQIQLGMPHPPIVNILWCVCTHPINLIGIHLLHCAHGNKHIGTHDAVHNTFATIARDASFHVGRK